MSWPFTHGWELVQQIDVDLAKSTWTDLKWGFDNLLCLQEPPT